MKYHKIEIKGHYWESGRIASDVDVENIHNADYYFKRIRNGEIVIDAPIFDNFYLQSFDKKEFWEWKLFDVHGFIGEASRLSTCWFISKKLKLLLNQFRLPNPNHYYASKLKYKENKLDYYVFQFAGKLIYEHTLEYINYINSIFWNPEKDEDIIVQNKDNFLFEYDRVDAENRSIHKIIQNKKLVLKEPLDFFPMNSLSMGNIISEKLKNAIEETGIEGFEFSELDYEVVVE